MTRKIDLNFLSRIQNLHPFLATSIALQKGKDLFHA